MESFRAPRSWHKHFTVYKFILKKTYPLLGRFYYLTYSTLVNIAKYIYDDDDDHQYLLLLFTFYYIVSIRLSLCLVRANTTCTLGACNGLEILYEEKHIIIINSQPLYHHHHIRVHHHTLQHR